MYVKKEDADRLIADAVRMVGTLAVTLRDTALIVDEKERKLLAATTGQEIAMGIERIDAAYKELKVYVPR